MGGRSRRRQDGLPVGLLAVCIVSGLLVVAPVFVTLVQALHGGLGGARTALDTSSTLTLILHSIEVSAVATPLCGVIGVGSAWFVERTDLPGRRLWAVLSVVPLTIPPFVTSYAWAGFGPSFQGFIAAAGIISFTYYPIVFLLVAVALRGLDPALEESSRSLGLGGMGTFFRVVLPQLRPALLGGMLLVVLDALIEFDAFVGLKFHTFSLDVYAQYQLGFGASGAATLAIGSIALCVALLFGEAHLRGHANYTRVSQGARRVAERHRLGRAKIPVLLAFAGVLAVSIGIPVAMLVKWFTETSNAGLSSASGNLRYLLPATITTVEVGVAAAFVALVLALPIALASVRHGGRSATLLERATYLSFALPDLVGAIAIAYAASHWAPFLYGSFELLVYAEAVLFVPFAVVALRATFGQVERSFEDSARSLGLGPLRTFCRVTIPLTRPGILAALVLVFSFTLGDLSTTQVLLPINLYTLGTEFNANSSTVLFAAAAPFAAVLIGLAVVAAYLLMSRFGKVRGLAVR